MKVQKQRNYNFVHVCIFDFLIYLQNALQAHRNKFRWTFVFKYSFTSWVTAQTNFKECPCKDMA